MKTIVPAILICTLFTNVQAQNNNSAVNRVPDSFAYAQTAKALAEIAILNKDNAVAVTEANTMASEYNYKGQKTAWLDNFRASGNINSFSNTRDVNNITGQAFYPRYNIGVSVPFGIFVNQPKQTKAAYYSYQAQVENLKQAKQNMRLQVITLYYNYVRTLRLYELQEASLQDAEFATKKTEEKFGRGEVNLDDYTSATRRYNSEQAAKISMERDLMVARAELEMLLGMPLETALAQARTPRRNLNR